MSQLKVPGGAKEASIEVTVIRANGNIENLGVVSYWNKNPLLRVLFLIKRYAKWLT